MVPGMATLPGLVHTGGMRAAILLVTLLTAGFAQHITPPTDPARALALALRRIGAEGRLLVVTAHPDDEDNSLIAYYKHGRGFDVTLLTVTRGDGGQNEIGEELFEGIGVLRSEELRSAHLYDGARQRFTRAFEFGYSFSVTETFDKWGEEEVLRDVVKVVREVRPHVIVTMSISTSGGGRHHQASAFLARRAFDVAAQDVWPELGEPWAALRLFESGRGSPREPRWNVPTSDYDPVLGCTYRELGFRARSFHKCQGTGQVARLSAGNSRFRTRGGRRLAMRRGPPPPEGGDLFAGLEVYRDPRSGKLSTTAVDVWGAAGAPSPADPEQCARRLEKLLATSAPSARGPVFDALSLAIPLHVEAVADKATVLPGDRTRVQILLHNHSSRAITVSGAFLRATLRRGQEPHLVEAWSGMLKPGQREVASVDLKIPEDADAWTVIRLDREDGADRYVDALDRLHDPSLARVVVVADAGGVPLNVDPVPVTRRSVNAAFPSSEEVDLVLLPRVQVRLDPALIPVPLSPGNAEASVSFDVHVSQRAGERSRLIVRMLPERGEGRYEATIDVSGTGTERVTFRKMRLAGEPNRRWRLSAHLLDDDDNETPAVACQEVHYPHIRRVYLERPARAEVVMFPCVVPEGVRVGWVEGTGDQVDDCLELAGVKLHRLSAEDLLQADLGRFDVIVTGVRAYKVRDDLKAANGRLRSWMEAGGRMVVLYNKSPDMNGGRGARGGSPWAPYTARVGRSRVTVEEAPVHVLNGGHRFLSSPNAIGEADWSGWVQERGLYFLEARDKRYEDLLRIDEPWPGNKGPKRGSLVTAPVGRGSWTYVGLALFRQLPAGVPGGYRLLMNLLAQPARSQ